MDRETSSYLLLPSRHDRAARKHNEKTELKSMFYRCFNKTGIIGTPQLVSRSIPKVLEALRLELTFSVSRTRSVNSREL